MTSRSPVPTGSVLRVPAYAYKKWGIKITSGNIGELKVNAGEAYRVEWQDTGERLNALVGQAATAAGLGDVNAIMNRRVGEITARQIAEILRQRGSFFAIDIGAGTGATSKPVLEELGKLGVSARDSKVLIIEPSEKRALAAKATLEEIPFVRENGIKIEAVVDRDISALRDLDTNSIDIDIRTLQYTTIPLMTTSRN